MLHLRDAALAALASLSVLTMRDALTVLTIPTVPTTHTTYYISTNPTNPTLPPTLPLILPYLLTLLTLPYLLYLLPGAAQDPSSPCGVTRGPNRQRRFRQRFRLQSDRQRDVQPRRARVRKFRREPDETTADCGGHGVHGGCGGCRHRDSAREARSPGGA